MKRFLTAILTIAMMLSVMIAIPRSTIAVNSEEFNGDYYIKNADVVEMCTLCEHCQSVLKENIAKYNHVN